MGHSAHVTNVRFSCGDQQLVSTGGADTALVVWRYGGAWSDQSAGQSDVSSRSTGYMSEESDTDSEEEGGTRVGIRGGAKGVGAKGVGHLGVKGRVGLS